MIVFHHNDADGRCAAAIVKRWFDRQEKKNRPAGDHVIRFVEMDYKMECPVDQINRLETVVIVDFSFKPEVMAQVKAATDIGEIWCDHHVTAKDYNYNVAGERDFSEKGLSGCECTWKFFFPLDSMPVAIRLLGDYDAWRLQQKPDCFNFYEGLKMEDTLPESPMWQALLDEDLFTLNRIALQGRSAIQYRDMYCGEMRKAFGYEAELDGVKAFVCNIYRFGSPGFGEMMQKYPMCICYAHDGEKFTVSLYSETGDVSVIAKNHGGGGHKGAAGFVCKELPWKKKE